MFKERYRVRQLEYCNKQMFGNLIVTCPTTCSTRMPKKLIQPVPITVKPVRTPEEVLQSHLMEAEKRRTSLLVDQLLLDIHNSIQSCTDYNSTTSGKSSQKYSNVESHDLHKRDVDDLSVLASLLKSQIERVGIKLVRRLKRREALRRQQEARCDVITCQLRELVPNAPEDMCFMVHPQSGESGFGQWVAAMKMVAQLPGGIPPEFRKRLWLTMAEKHLASKGVDWSRVERTCFSEWSHPDDGELGVQIVKDLHRTGCSLFCGEGGQENQALLKKVLLAYARWNKAVGYCQGFNMLAALILQVTDKSETDALKLMIYLIEGVLPDSYFADSLRGLSVDMAVFRELLRTRLPRLSKHLDLLQNMAKEGTTSYEPPLTNVFTMQWFLTLFCNCLPQPSVLRVWDLILLEGNEILLRTALAIWQALAERIVRVRTADEFYCVMGLLTNELLENNLIDANRLIKSVVEIGSLTELQSLREHYLYNINPWGGVPAPLQFSERQLRLYPKERLALDISALKKQYLKLRQRQRQAHVIFSAAISRQPQPKSPVGMKQLLLGKSALVPAKRLGPPKGSIPPARILKSPTLHWKDTEKLTSSSSSSDTELCDENEAETDSSDRTNQNSPTGELPEDNPCDTPILINQDDTLEEDANEKSDTNIFESLVTDESETVVNKSADIDSEEDSVDFELFLEDRVKGLQTSDEDKKMDLSRRNSERALQIIQENSLILHRILQCQSRLSLSPPLTENEKGDEQSNTSEDFDQFSATFQSSDLPGPSQQEINEEDNLSETSSYRSRYSDILLKSKNLNEKYNDLILNSSKARGDESTQLAVHDHLEELIDFGSSPVPEPVTEIKEEESPMKDDIDFKDLDDFLSRIKSENDEYRKQLKENQQDDESSYRLPPPPHLEILSDVFCDKSCSSAEIEAPKSVKLLDGIEDFDETSLMRLMAKRNKSPIEIEDDKSWTTRSRLSSCNSFETKSSTSDFNFSEDPTVSSKLESPCSERSYDSIGRISPVDYSLSSNVTMKNSKLDVESKEKIYCHKKSHSDSLRHITRMSPSLYESDQREPRSSMRRDVDFKKFSPVRRDLTEPTRSLTSPTNSCTLSENSFFCTAKNVTDAEKSPTKLLDLKGISKSPSKNFNPFPVPLATRQSKDVAVKLGLYKK